MRVHVRVDTDDVRCAGEAVMGATSWPEAFMAVGIMASVAWAVTSMIRGPRVVYIQSDEEDEDGMGSGED